MIADWMYALFEQAFKRQEAESKITHEMIPLAEHLIKMLKWEDSLNNKKHMKNILRGWGKRVFDYTISSSPKFKVDQLHRIICEEPLRKFNNTIYRLKGDYDISSGGSLKPYRSDEEVYELLQQILSEYAFKLFQVQSNSRIIVNLEDIITEDLQIYIYGL